MNKDVNKEINVLQVAGNGLPASVVLCLSGTGSNAEVMLKYALAEQCNFKVALLFTDAPESSAAFRLAKEFDIPVEHLDIKKFYAENGENSTLLNTSRRWELRRQWSEKIWQMIEPYNVDFAVFAGFVPLNSLPEKMPCLNVHPGDLTVEKNGVRRYAGLHYKPVENALLDGNCSLRSSVILVQSLKSDDNCDIDGGPVLGISSEVPVDLQGHTVEKLHSVLSSRTKAPFDDELRQVAKANIENLKIHGDHIVLPRVADAFAAGRYGLSADGRLYFLSAGGSWQKVQTVEFAADGGETLLTAEKMMAKRARKGMWRFLKYLYTKIIRGKGSPDFISRGWALGMFVGCVVPIFCQLIVAVPLSFVIRGSRVGAALGTFITTPPTAIFIYPVQIYIGNRLIGGKLSFEMIRDSAAQMLHGGNWQAFADMGGELIAAFFAGGLLWAAIMTPLTYFVVRFMVVRYRKMREALRNRKNGAAL